MPHFFSSKVTLHLYCFPKQDRINIKWSFFCSNWTNTVLCHKRLIYKYKICLWILDELNLFSDLFYYFWIIYISQYKWKLTKRSILGLCCILCLMCLNGPLSLSTLKSYYKIAECVVFLSSQYVMCV